MATIVTSPSSPSSLAVELASDVVVLPVATRPHEDRHTGFLLAPLPHLHSRSYTSRDITHTQAAMVTPTDANTLESRYADGVHGCPVVRWTQI